MRLSTVRATARGALVTAVCGSVLALPASASAAWRVANAGPIAKITGTFAVPASKVEEFEAEIQTINGKFTCTHKQIRTGAAVTCKVVRAKLPAGFKLQVLGSYPFRNSFKTVHSPTLKIAGTFKGSPKLTWIGRAAERNSATMFQVQFTVVGTTTLTCKQDGVKLKQCNPLGTMVYLGSPGQPELEDGQEHTLEITASTPGQTPTVLIHTWIYDHTAPNDGGSGNW